MPSKRKKEDYGNIYRDRVPLEDDYETVSVWSASRGPNGYAKGLPRVYLPSAWTAGAAWAPEDSLEYSLDEDDAWFDEALEADVGDVMDGIAAKPKQKKSSKQVSQVTLVTEILCELTFSIHFAGATPRILEGKLARAVSRRATSVGGSGGFCSRPMLSRLHLARIPGAFGGRV